MTTAMTKEELHEYMPKRMLSAAGATLKACEMHFCEGLPVGEAAKRCKIHKVTASKAIVSIRKKMKKDGWKEKRIERVVYYK